jgi:2-polyprenyl-3-methyl-5-hydroxy-6-metoxy-1,4-benzoquinol methylase
MDRTVKHKRNCVVCGGKHTELLFRQQFSEISESSLLDGYDVVVCKTCGFCFAENLPSQDAFDAYYREMSKYEHLDRSGEASEFEMRQFPLLARFIQAHLPDKKARILEIGCANAGLLNALKQSGYPNVLGVDPSPACARNAERLYQIRVLTCAISDLEPELGPFDFIILVAVLEHIRDLDYSLRKIQALLSPGGLVYMEVPDATRFAMSPDAPFQEFSIEHINYFTPVSLANLMGRYGFSEVFSEQASYDQTDTHIGYAARIVFRKVEATINFTKDPGGESALKEYISASQKVENRIHETVRELIASQRPLVVWGVGTHTQRLLATGGLAAANIVAFVDSNPNYVGKKLSNVPILAPAEIGKAGEPILISSRIFQSEILQQIRFDLKLDNEVLTLYEE